MSTRQNAREIFHVLTQREHLFGLPVDIKRRAFLLVDAAAVQETHERSQLRRQLEPNSKHNIRS